MNKNDLLKKLYKEYGLVKEDVHQHKHYTIIARSGIEKIQYQQGIDVQFVPVTVEAQFAAVKAIGRKDERIIETFGSASPGTSQNKYYLEMAEKRALSRVVLKLSNLYEAGVKGEDEADDFKALAVPPVAGNPVAGIPVAGIPVAGIPVAGIPVAGIPEKSTEDAAPTAAPQLATAKQKELLTKLLNSHVFDPAHDAKARKLGELMSKNSLKMTDASAFIDRLLDNKETGEMGVVSMRKDLEERAKSTQAQVNGEDQARFNELFYQVWDAKQYQQACEFLSENVLPF